MKRKMLFGFIMTCSLVLNVAFVAMWMAHAVPRHFMKHCQYGCAESLHQKCPMQKALALSDSQWTLLHPKIESIRETTSGLYRELAKNRMALVDELEKTPTDSAALSACRERIISGQKKIQELVVNHILEEKKMLTQEQQRRFFSAIRGNMSCAGVPGMMGMTPLESGEQPEAQGACGH
jgi:Spy/CpxP family protein refolding chaperone